MDSFFKNIILVVSGFILAIFFIKSPVNPSSNFFKISDNQQEEQSSQESNKLYSSNSKERGEKSSRSSKSSLFASTFNTSSRGNRDALDANVHGYSDVANDQDPTAPPEDQFEDEQESDEAKNEDEEKEEESKQQNFAKNYESDYNNNRNEEAPSSSKNDRYSNSAAQFIGATTNPAQNNANQGSPSTGAGVFVGGGSRSINDDNSDSGVIPDEFTSAGLNTAKKLYNEESISEPEYLEYLSLGLNSSEANLKRSALNELVSLRTPNAFAIQSQFATSTSANNQLIAQAVVNKYKSAADLRFLSQMVGSSSEESQVWSIQALDTIMKGSNIDFTNQEIKKALVQNVSRSLERINADHPSYGQAQSIYQNINHALS